MTAPGVRDIPGLDEIAAWGQYLGIPGIADTIAKAQMLMQTDPAAVAAGGERLRTVASGLDLGGQDIQRAGNDVLASGLSGQFANALAPHSAGVASDVAGTGAVATQLADLLGETAKTFAGGQNVVMTITPATAATLRMLRQVL